MHMHPQVQQYACCMASTTCCTYFGNIFSALFVLVDPCVQVGSAAKSGTSPDYYLRRLAGLTTYISTVEALCLDGLGHLLSCMWGPTQCKFNQQISCTDQGNRQ